MTDMKTDRWTYGGIRKPAVDPSRIRRSCLGRISDDPLVFCQGIPRQGKSVCDECLVRNNTSLEQVIRKEAKRLLAHSWLRGCSLSELGRIAARLEELRRFLTLAGCPTIDIDTEWRDRHFRYVEAGGKIPFRELRG